MSMIETLSDKNNSFLSRREIICDFKGLGGKLEKIQAEIELPAQTNHPPMTYMHNGKQYIVMPVAAPGHPAELVALALPDKE